jgi:hypothetical protein
MNTNSVPSRERKSELPVDPDKKARKPWQVYLSGSPTLIISL